VRLNHRNAQTVAKSKTNENDINYLRFYSRQCDLWGVHFVRRKASKNSLNNIFDALEMS
jgi:hypothetical protein